MTFEMDDDVGDGESALAVSVDDDDVIGDLHVQIDGHDDDDELVNVLRPLSKIHQIISILLFSLADIIRTVFDLVSGKNSFLRYCSLETTG
jgi:hypothetical protein